MVAEMNEEMLHWLPGDEEAVLDIGCPVQPHQSFTSKITLPPQRTIPSLIELHLELLQSRDKLFFFVFDHPHSHIKDCQLVWVTYDATLSAHPNGLQIRCLLVDWYIQHPDDHTFNVSNQHYWLEYLSSNSLSINSSDHTSWFHLLQPHPNSEHYASTHKLLPYLH